MLRNFTVEADLKRYVPQKDRLKWSDQSDYSDQKTASEQEVITDLKSKGYKPHKLMTPLTLGTDAVQDVVSTGRLVVNCSVFGTQGDVTLLGCNTSDGTFETVTTLTIAGTGETSKLFTKYYQYYKITLGGSFTAAVYLVETSYDLLFVFKWLEVICQNQLKNGAEYFGELASWFADKYLRLIDNMPVVEDTNDDGDVTDEYTQKGSSFSMVG